MGEGERRSATLEGAVMMRVVRVERTRCWQRERA